MSTECYAMVRGSALRITGLNKRGQLPEPLLYGVSKSVARVTIDEIADGGGHEVVTNDASQGEDRRLHLVSSARTIRYTADINFLRLDASLLSLMVDVPLVYNAAGDVVGFDRNTKVPAKAFAMEVWTKLAGRPCADRPAGFGEGSFGGMFFGDTGEMITPPLYWGYTLFPFLKGGTLSGFSFDRDGSVSFNLRRAQTRRSGKWGIGPYFVNGWCKLPTPVSGNVGWRQTLVTSRPPVQTDGVVTYVDEIDGGTASMTTPDVLDGGTAFEAGPCVVDGGAA